MLVEDAKEVQLLYICEEGCKRNETNVVIVIWAQREKTDQGTKKRDEGILCAYIPVLAALALLKTKSWIIAILKKWKIQATHFSFVCENVHEVTSARSYAPFS